MKESENIKVCTSGHCAQCCPKMPNFDAFVQTWTKNGENWTKNAQIWTKKDKFGLKMGKFGLNMRQKVTCLDTVL